MFIILSCIYFFYFACIGSVIVYFPHMLKVHNFSISQIGILLSIVPLVRFLYPFLFAKHITLNSKIIFISIVINFFAVVAYYYFLHSFIITFIITFIYGVSYNQFLPFLETITIEKYGKDIYGKIRLFGSIGFIATVLLIPNIKDMLLAPLYVLSFTSFLLYALLIVILLKIKSYEHIEDCNDMSFSLLKVWPFWVAIFFVQFSFGGFYSFFTIYELDHGIKIDNISYLWTFGVICEILMLFSQKSILKKYSMIKIMQFCIFTLCVRWFLLYLFATNEIIVLFSQSLHAFSFALFHSASIFYLFSQYKNKNLAQHFYLGISFGLGGFLGSNFAGYFYGDKLFLYESIFAFIALLMFSNKFQKLVKHNLIKRKKSYN